VLAALTIRWVILDAYVIPSGSMLPSLLIGDRLFVAKFVYGVRVPFTTSEMPGKISMSGR
jgi:signal peptidase I